MEVPWEDVLAGRCSPEACPSLLEELALEENTGVDVDVAVAVAAAAAAAAAAAVAVAAAAAVVLAVVPAFGGLDPLCGRRRW